MDEPVNIEPQVTDESEGMSLSELLKKDEAAFARRVTGIVDEHYQISKPYREKCEENIMYWRNQHWQTKAGTNKNEPNPNVPAVHSMIENCIADAMDNFPDQIMRGVNGDDDIYAAVITDGVRFTMQRADYEEAYERCIASAHKVGTGVIQTLFNRNKSKGLGDIDYKYYPIIDVVWDTNVMDYEDGRFFATIDYMPEDQIKALYPDKDLSQCSADTEEEVRDGGNSTVSDEGRSKKRTGLRIINVQWKDPAPIIIDGKSTGSNVTYLNSARIVGNVVLESHPKQYDYDSYMVEMLPYITIDDEPWGLSLIDIFKDEADIINLIQKAYVMNLQASSDLRYLVNNTANINEDELLNHSKVLIHADEIHEAAVRELKVEQFSTQALNYLQASLGRMKEYSGQLDVNIGQSSAGVTAASAIMALQEYGSKRPRAFTRMCYRMHKRIVRHTIYLQRKHYTTERVVRISRTARDLIMQQIAEQERAMAEAQKNGEKIAPAQMPVRFVNGKAYVDYSQFDLANFDEDYDIDIVPQKKTAATSNLINSVVQQLANSGLFQGKEDLLLDLLEVPGIGEKTKKIRDRINVQAQFEQVVQQAQQAIEQMQQVVKQNEQIQKQNAELQKALVQEKINTLRAEVRGALKNTGEGETNQGPEDAEQAIADFEQEMGLSQQA